MLKTKILLWETLKNDKENKKKLIRSLGYRNVNKGYRRISKSLETDYVDKELLYKLEEVFGIKMNEILSTIQESEKEIEERKKERKIEIEKIERANFIPHLLRICERKIPRPIFVAAFFGVEHFKYVNLPPYLLYNNVDEQLEIIETIIKEDYKNSNGNAGPFGSIIGYYFRKTFDETFKFDTNGKFIEKSKFVFKKEEASLTVKDRKLKF